MAERNFTVILNSRPGVNGHPTEDNFRTEECPYPSENLQEHQVLVKTLYLSVDPALRCRMNHVSGVDYMTAWNIGETVDGLNGVGIIVKSQSNQFEEGDYVTSTFLWPWMAYFIFTDTHLRKITNEFIISHLTLALGALGLTGLTAYLGITEKGHVTRGSNQTIVVSAAAGSTGSLAGQIARLEGCERVVGICGTQEKCDVITKELGFDAAINYKTEDVSERVKETCPNGVDVYFDNVGGDISYAVIKQMNRDSHIILCGQIALYNKDIEYPPKLPEDIQQILDERNITRERFLVLNYPEKFHIVIQILISYIKEGKLKSKETITEGIENASKAFVNLMIGGNIGKQIIHVADP